MPHALSRSPHRHPPARAWVGRGTKSVWVAEGVEGGNQAGGRIMNSLPAKGKTYPGVLLSQEPVLPPPWSPSPRWRAHKQGPWLSQHPLCPDTPPGVHSSLASWLVPAHILDG